MNDWDDYRTDKQLTITAGTFPSLRDLIRDWWTNR